MVEGKTASSLLTYEVSDAGAEWTIDAASADEARRVARDSVDWIDASAIRSTTWTDICVSGPLDGDSEVIEDHPEHLDRDCQTISVEPAEPPCSDPVNPRTEDSDEGHDWREPYALLGGLRENPGVHGHGGGVICNSICVRCGCSRISDSWAQRADTGEQGLRSVEYDPDDERLDEYLGQLDVGDLEQEEITSTDEWSVLLVYDDVTRCHGVALLEATDAAGNPDAGDTNVDWFHGEENARREAVEVIAGMRARDDAQEDDDA